MLAKYRKSSGIRLENEVIGFIPGREKMFMYSDIFLSFISSRSIPIRYASGTSSVSMAMDMKCVFRISAISLFKNRL